MLTTKQKTDEVDVYLSFLFNSGGLNTLRKNYEYQYKMNGLIQSGLCMYEMRRVVTRYSFARNWDEFVLGGLGANLL